MRLRGASTIAAADCRAWASRPSSRPPRTRVFWPAPLGGRKPDHRPQFPGAPKPEFPPADEPLLEQALDDRASSVRAVAARLLTRIRESALAQRMRDRADAMLAAATKG